MFPVGLRVAVVHECFTVYAGAEAVLKEILACFPQADVYALIDFMSEQDKQRTGISKVKTSFMQKLPAVRKHYRSYLPLMPLAIEQFDLTDYDLVISSSYAVAKGIITGPNQVHISYVHSPMRYAWDLQHQYLKVSGNNHGLRGMIAKYILHKMRIWDVRTAFGVDGWIANSQFIAKRIKKVYGQSSQVIYPPVDTDRFILGGARKDYYVTVSRLVPYKRVDLLAEAFSLMPDRKLVIIGDGPEIQRIKKFASPNITLLGHKSNDEVVRYMQEAKAFLFGAEEDFGIVLVESQACGTPVIAYGKGGALESVVSGITGRFFPDQSPEAVIAAVQIFESELSHYQESVIRTHAEKFGRDRFRREFMNALSDIWKELEGNSNVIVQK